MFETDEFPEGGLSSESEEDGLDLSHPDTGAYSNSEEEDIDKISDNESEGEGSMDELPVVPSEGDSASSTEDKSPLLKR